MRLLFVLLFFFQIPLYAQELNCQVTIVADAKLEVSSLDKEVFEQLKQSIYEFMNSTKWTKDKFLVEERINCNLQLQITSIPSQGNYSGSLQVQSSRPVFNSSYTTTVFNFLDQNLNFQFTKNTVLLYAPNQFRDNLTSILAFYANFILGMDYDSFALRGGTPFFNEAQQIVTNAQSSGGEGWQSNEASKKNRFWLVDNVLQELFSPLRVSFYEYHRNGLDQLYTNKSTAVAAVYTALEPLSQIVSTRPNSINVLNYVQAKSTEIKNMYLEATAEQKTQMVELLKKLDPVNSSNYQEILD
jgi:Domain of unknown function (DUF4835)